MLLFPNNNSPQKKRKQNKKHQVLNIELTQQGLKIKNSVLLTTKLSMLLIKYKTHLYVLWQVSIFKIGFDRRQERIQCLEGASIINWFYWVQEDFNNNLIKANDIHSPIMAYTHSLQ